MFWYNSTAFYLAAFMTNSVWWLWQHKVILIIWKINLENFFCFHFFKRGSWSIFMIKEAATRSRKSIRRLIPPLKPGLSKCVIVFANLYTIKYTSFVSYINYRANACEPFEIFKCIFSICKNFTFDCLIYSWCTAMVQLINQGDIFTLLYVMPLAYMIRPGFFSDNFHIFFQNVSFWIATVLMAFATLKTLFKK